MTETQQIACRLVTARADARRVDRNVVTELKASIAKLGLMAPLVVRRKKIWHQSEWAEGFELIAGCHRLHAVQELGWNTVSAIVEEFNDVEAELAMISENLHRADLTALQRDEQVARWVKLAGQSFQIETFDSKRSDGKGHRPKSGINAASVELGLSQADAHRAVKVASLSPEAKATAARLGLDNNRTALLEAAVLPTEQQSDHLVTRASAKPQAKDEEQLFWEFWARLSNDTRRRLLPQLKALA